MKLPWCRKKGACFLPLPWGRVYLQYLKVNLVLCRHFERISVPVQLTFNCFGLVLVWLFPVGYSVVHPVTGVPVPRCPTLQTTILNMLCCCPFMIRVHMPTWESYQRLFSNSSDDFYFKKRTDDKYFKNISDCGEKFTLFLAF